MYTFQNITTLDRYEQEKKQIRFEYVPNTAAGFENCRKYIIHHGYKYFVSANTEKDYFLLSEDLRCPSDKRFSVNFTVDGDIVTIKSATCGNRSETADKYLKKYAAVLCWVHSCIKYDKIIEYKPYRAA